MTEEGWYEDFEWTRFFPNPTEIAGIEYACDDEGSCWNFNE